MEEKLKNLKVAIVIDVGFEQDEMTEPRKALEESGAETEIISTKIGNVKAWDHWKWGNDFTVHKTFEHANPNHYDALLIPGGSKGADKLRKNKEAVDFVRTIFESGKPVAAICHGPWLLAEAGVLKGKTITSYPSIKDDMLSAGATWVNEAVVVDDNLVTSRRPKDIPQFTEKMLEEFEKVVSEHKD